MVQHFGKVTQFFFFAKELDEKINITYAEYGAGPGRQWKQPPCRSLWIFLSVMMTLFSPKLTSVVTNVVSYRHEGRNFNNNSEIGYT